MTVMSCQAGKKRGDVGSRRMTASSGMSGASRTVDDVVVVDDDDK